MTRIFCTFVTVIFMKVCLAQSGNYHLHARAAGMAYATTSIAGEIGFFNNPASISSISGWHAIATYKNPYLVKELHEAALGLVIPAPVGNFGLSAYRFGNSLHSEHSLALSFSNEIGFTRLGGRARYIQYRTEGYGSFGAITLDFGGIVSFSKHVTFGGLVMNVNRAKMKNLDDERVPTILKAGFAYSPSEALSIATEIEKDARFAPQYKLGMQYQWHQSWRVALGAMMNPASYHTGIGFNSRLLQIDYALRWHPELGITQSATLSLNFQSRERQ